MQNKLELFDFFQLNPHQKAELTEKIKYHQGKLRIVVHPFYSEYTGSADILTEPRYPVRRNALLKKLTEDETPTLVFEESGRISYQLAEKLRPLELHGSLFVVPTYPDSPRPVTEPRNFDKSWEIMGDKLKELGVTQIKLAGEYLCISGNYFDGCVGATGNSLDELGFRVDFTPVTSPTIVLNGTIFPPPFHQTKPTARLIRT